tara:strand:+ start:147 stop:596 length:450 start_codon:yes stop_codon:yes gene_type:complete
MSNKKDWVVEKLNRLVKLSRATEPDQPDDTSLFTPHTIDAYDLLDRVEKGYDSMSSSDMVEIMLQANRIWMIRKKVWNGEWDALPEAQLMYEVEDYIIRGQKINGIKHYKHNSERVFGKPYGLKESKQAIDNMEEDLRKRGKLKPKGYN